jgi:hypothetical protein
MSETIYDLDRQGLEHLLIGKVITRIDEGAGTITLNDGTILQLEDTSSCCAWFDGELKKIDLTENAITAVAVKDLGQSDYDEHWELVVLSADRAVCAIEIEGDSSNGYYCHSINLVVKKPGAF